VDVDGAGRVIERTTTMTRRIFILAGLWLAALVAQAQSLTNSQLVTLRTAVIATPDANACLVAGNVTCLQTWANTATATLGWLTAAPVATVDEAPSYTTYDALAAGKRDSWVRFLAAPRNFSKAKVRSWVVDVWGNATASSNAEAILLAGTEAATNAQVAVGGSSKTTGTVSALDRNYWGIVTTNEATRLIFKDNGTICQTGAC
jgi:hypothetical protein